MSDYPLGWNTSDSEAKQYAITFRAFARGSVAFFCLGRQCDPPHLLPMATARPSISISRGRGKRSADVLGDATSGVSPYIAGLPDVKSAWSSGKVSS